MSRNRRKSAGDSGSDEKFSMTCDFVTYVWKTFTDRKLTSVREHALMLALAAYANRQTGMCFPSDGALSMRTHIPEESISEVRKSLAAKKLIRYEPGTGRKGTRYQLDFLSGFLACAEDPIPEKEEPPEERDTRKTVHRGGGISTPQGGGFPPPRGGDFHPPGGVKNTPEQIIEQTDSTALDINIEWDLLADMALKTVERLIAPDELKKAHAAFRKAVQGRRSDHVCQVFDTVRFGDSVRNPVGLLISQIKQVPFNEGEDAMREDNVVNGPKFAELLHMVASRKIKEEV